MNSKGRHFGLRWFVSEPRLKLRSEVAIAIWCMLAGACVVFFSIGLLSALGLSSRATVNASVASSAGISVLLMVFLRWRAATGRHVLSAVLRETLFERSLVGLFATLALVPVLTCGLLVTQLTGWKASWLLCLLFVFAVLLLTWATAVCAYWLRAAAAQNRGVFVAGHYLISGEFAAAGAALIVLGYGLQPSLFKGDVSHVVMAAYVFFLALSFFVPWVESKTIGCRALDETLTTYRPEPLSIKANLVSLGWVVITGIFLAGGRAITLLIPDGRIITGCGYALVGLLLIFGVYLWVSYSARKVFRPLPANFYYRVASKKTPSYAIGFSVIFLFLATLVAVNPYFGQMNLSALSWWLFGWGAVSSVAVLLLMQCYFYYAGPKHSRAVNASVKAGAGLGFAGAIAGAWGLLYSQPWVSVAGAGVLLLSSCYQERLVKADYREATKPSPFAVTPSVQISFPVQPAQPVAMSEPVAGSAEDVGWPVSPTLRFMIGCLPHEFSLNVARTRLGDFFGYLNKLEGAGLVERQLPVAGAKDNPPETIYVLTRTGMALAAHPLPRDIASILRLCENADVESHAEAG